MRRQIFMGLAMGVLMAATVPSMANHTLLPLPSGVGGTVTNEQGEPIEGICVDASGQYMSSYTVTRSDGTYEAKGLPPGEYTVYFYDCSNTGYLNEYYDDAQSYSSATRVEVGTSLTTGIDAVLAKGGSITGVVTDASGNPLVGICVEADGENDYTWAQTGFDGSYKLVGLLSGTYSVSFYCSSTYAEEWYDDKPSRNLATPVSVQQGLETAGINASLALRASAPTDPEVDLAITDLQIENVPVRTDLGNVGYTGWLRDVEVSLANLDTSTGRGRLVIEACTPTDGSCRMITREEIQLPAGATLTRSYRWDGLGSFGDVKVTAILHLCEDPGWHNNIRTKNHYVGIGGVGYGVDLVPTFDWWYSEC